VRPLDGIRVLDLTRLLPGAAATMLLADFGAEVLKVEEPSGDYARHMPPLVEGEGAVFRATNRGKKSIRLDLKTTEGKGTLLELAAGSDVLIEGFRPGVMQRLGLDYETIRGVNQGLVYVSLTGFGQDGPYAKKAGHDINYIALGGLLGMIGGIPGTQIADLAGGSLPAVIGILLALAARQKSGCGQYVDISMLDGVAWLMTLPLAVYEATGEIPERGATTLSGRYACYQTYEVADGRWLAVGALEKKFWTALCEKLGRPDFVEKQFSEGVTQEHLIAELRRIFRERTSEEWLDLLDGADTCVTLVRNVAEVAADKSVAKLIPRLSGTPGRSGGRPPRIGEH
jgi:crotonobetainyl-CoA:carnitine CoA-transferase CaiB-like acyl-CoA transferase